MEDQQQELEDKCLNKKFKYYGVGGLSNWVASINAVSYITTYTKHGEFINPYIISDIGVMYYLNEILILN